MMRETWYLVIGFVLCAIAGVGLIGGIWYFVDQMSKVHLH